MAVPLGMIRADAASQQQLHWIGRDRPPSEEEIDRGTYPWSVPAVAALVDGVALDPGVIWSGGQAASRSD